MVKCSTYKKILEWTRRRYSIWIEDYVHRLYNHNTIVRKVCNQLFLLKWESEQCAILCNDNVRRKSICCCYIGK